MYPQLHYETGETEEYISNSPASYLYEFIKKTFFDNDCSCIALPFYEPLVSETYGYVEEEDGDRKLMSLREVSYEYKREFGEPDAVGWVLEFDIEEVRKKRGTYRELLEILDFDDFVLKREYADARECLARLVAKQKPTGDSLFDLFN